MDQVTAATAHVIGERPESEDDSQGYYPAGRSRFRLRRENQAMGALRAVGRCGNCSRPGRELCGGKERLASCGD